MEKLTMHFHDLASVPGLEPLMKVVPGLMRYMERVLVMAEPEDVVVLAREPDSEYLNWLSSVGIGPRKSNVIVVNNDDVLYNHMADSIIHNESIKDKLVSLSNDNGGALLSPFMVSNKEWELVDQLNEDGGEVELFGSNPGLVTNWANSKVAMRAFFNTLDIPVPLGTVVNVKDGENMKYERIMDSAMSVFSTYITGKFTNIWGEMIVPSDRDWREPIRGAPLPKHWDPKVLVKGDIGASGSSTYQGIPKAEDIINMRDDNNLFLVEAKYDFVTSPNVLYKIDCDGSFEFISMSDQRLDDNLIHQGNIYPSQSDVKLVKLYGDRMAETFAEQGYRGYVAWDMIQTSEGEVIPVECNPRVNGCTYGLYLRKKLGAEAAYIANYKGDVSTFGELRDKLSDMLLRKGNRIGVIPYNTGCIEELDNDGKPLGKFSAVCLADSREGALKMHYDLQEKVGGKAY